MGGSWNWFRLIPKFIISISRESEILKQIKIEIRNILEIVLNITWMSFVPLILIILFAHCFYTQNRQCNNSLSLTLLECRKQIRSLLLKRLSAKLEARSFKWF